MTVNSSLSLNLTSTEALNLGLAAAFNVPSTLLPALAWAAGSGAGQVQAHWELKGVTLAAGAAVTYTLSALTDSLGRPVTFATVVALAVQVTSRTAGDALTLGGAAANPWAAPVGGGAQTWVVWDLDVRAAGASDGFAVAAGSSDQLKVVNSGSNPITFNIAIAGR